MSDQDQEQTAETEAEKAPWTPPEVSRMASGAAEAADFVNSDGSFSS